jgi:uncharacterized cupredoxin-like copper-binding protein
MEQQQLGGDARSWRRWSRLGAILTVGALVVAACGGDSGGSDESGGLTSSGPEDTDSAGTRTVEVEMRDNEFSPDQVEVSEGERVRFVFTNEGQATHDAVVGDEAAQAEHEAEMRATESEPEHGTMSTMSHGSEAEGSEAAITVDPGATGELTYSFDTDDAVLIGCHEPGHYDAGMKLTLDVTSS